MSNLLLTRFALPRYSTGALSLLKWLALALMVVDHGEAFWLQRSFDSQLGRLVFPIFAFVLGYNLARPGVDRLQLLRRLLAFGTLTLPWHAMLVGAWTPANVLFTFASAVGVVHLLDVGKHAAAFALLAVSGLFVEYWWPGIGLVVGVWMMAQGPSRFAWHAVALNLVLLAAMQSSFVPLLAAPLVWFARDLPIDLPRMKWAFYVFYPAHLAAFVLMGAPGLRG